MSLLRGELLQGRAVALAPGVPKEVAVALSGLGARVELLEESGELAQSDDELVGQWARAHGPLHALVYDAGPSFAGAGPQGLAQALERTWAAVREVAVGALIEGQEPGKIILLGPRPDAGPHAEAARAALENLSRTLSVEWARYDVTAVTVAPGPRSSDRHLADLVCFLCSEGGAYLSGCRLDVGGVMSGGDR
ncbi:MAG: hypothetical protein ACJ764_08650 [Solirubrobacteraceae bacterium]